ncbi:hypothetical protein ACHQM5_025674 [Ranunculus cassubicifolius]
MASHQSDQDLTVIAESGRQISNTVIRRGGGLSGENGVHGKETVVGDSDGGYIGVLDVYVHQARDIQNICIYHKQDVYAKLCLTSDPKSALSTKIINGGGQNPIFNDNLRLNVKTGDSSLKCEIWMLSRVQNYLQDQLLGFAMIPLSDLFVANGKLAQEFSLSSSDLFHSHSGYVQLSISYSGTQPEVFAIPTPRAYLKENTAMQDSEILDSLPDEYDKIEFPDPNIVKENQLMVSQYFGMESQSSESLLTSDGENNLDSAGMHAVESFSEGSLSSIDVTKKDTPASSVSTNGSPSSSNPASSQSFCNTPDDSKSSNQELVSPLKEKNTDSPNDESDSPSGKPSSKSPHSILGVNVVQEKTVVQQEIVDMYLKSMQQFTESLAKMKLPMDTANGTAESGNANGSTDQKMPTPKSAGSRVFYGSRAFF